MLIYPIYSSGNIKVVLAHSFNSNRCGGSVNDLEHVESNGGDINVLCFAIGNHTYINKDNQNSLKSILKL